MESGKKIDNLESDAQTYAKAELLRRPGFLIRRLLQIHLDFLSKSAQRLRPCHCSRAS
jgi:hypothetical protein